MRRDLHRLSSQNFDVLIVGGGATGAFAARDAALRGLSVALVEARDFASATSAHNSKLAHGGLRYLRNLELGLVRESLRERRNLQRIAPHLVRPLPFLLPLYGTGFFERRKLAIGLTLYDALAYDKAWLDDPSQRLPGHRWIGKAALDGILAAQLAARGFESATHLLELEKGLFDVIIQDRGVDVPVEVVVEHDAAGVETRRRRHEPPEVA